MSSSQWNAISSVSLKKDILLIARHVSTKTCPRTGKYTEYCF